MNGRDETGSPIGGLEEPVVPPGHLGRLEIARLEAGELSGDEEARARAHVDGCPRCGAAHAALVEARAAFLARRPPAAFAAALAARRRPSRVPAGEPPGPGGPVAVEAKRRGRSGGRLTRPEREETGGSPFPDADSWGERLRRFVFGPAGWAAAVVAAVLVVWIVRPGSAPAPDPAGGRAPAPGTRLKAAVGLSFHVRSGGEVWRGTPGETLHPGDRIQLRYSTPAHRHLVVVSLDARGAVTAFYDDAGRSLAIEPGAGRLLDGSVILDDAIGPERIIGCFSRAPLDTADVLAAGRRALEAAGGDPRAVTALDLPCEQAGFVIEKRPR